MQHTVEWYVFQRVVYVTLQGDVELEDIANFSNDIIRFLNEGLAPVHIIIDDMKVGKPPIRLIKIKESLMYLDHPSLGWQVGVGDVNPLVHYIVPTIMQIAGVQFVRRKTKQDALDFLYKHDFTLKAKTLTE